MVVVMNLGTILVPPSRLTEGLTWMTTGISIGVALGAALAGLVIDAYGARAGFGIAIAAGVVMTIIVLLGRRTLHAASMPQGEQPALNAAAARDDRAAVSGLDA